MIIIISGASHTGKTALAQKLMERYKYPYMSVDHLKMELIRSGQTPLTVYDDDKLTEYLWDIIREIIKTAVENMQNLIIEGCYIPFDWQKSFDEEYLKDIKYICLIMSGRYITEHAEDIRKYADCIEKRVDGGFDTAELIRDNEYNLEMCRKYGLCYALADEEYFDVDKIVF